MSAGQEWRLGPMRLSDLDAVMEIENYSFPTPWKRHMYESDLTTNARSRFFVVRDAATGGIGAYSGTWFIYEEAHVGTIATAREYRGQRLAEQLLAYTAFHALQERLSYVILEVRVTNEPAKRLYERLGFELVGIRKGYYSDTGEDALLMTCDKLPGLAGRLSLKEE